MCQFSKMKSILFSSIALLIFSAASVCFAQCPKGIIERGVSAAQANSIVQYHNALRKTLAKGQVKGQPKASNMLQMRWDNSLAVAAQSVADTCVYQHRSIKDARFSVGQNLYLWSSTQWSSGASFTPGIQAWWDEHSTYVYGSKIYNHYTQVAWANTNLVGCGYAAYLSPSGWYTKFYVCNYGPAGNYVNMLPYKTGPGCDNLCTA